MEVIFVGTGSGKTQLKRFHTSLLIKTGNHNLLVDTGDAISKALLIANLDINLIDSIYITHTHADHFSGIASLLTQMKMAKRIKPICLYIHNSFVSFARNFLYHSFLFPETFDFEMKIIGFNFDSEINIADILYLLPIKNGHISNKYNVNSIPDINFISSSVLIKNENILTYYSSDIDSISDLSPINKFQPKYLIVESTHILFDELIEFINNSKMQKTFLVHINDEDGIVENYNKLSNELKSKIILTIDGMCGTLT